MRQATGPARTGTNSGSLPRTALRDTNRGFGPPPEPLTRAAAVCSTYLCARKPAVAAASGTAAAGSLCTEAVEDRGRKPSRSRWRRPASAPRTSQWGSRAYCFGRVDQDYAQAAAWQPRARDPRDVEPACPATRRASALAKTRSAQRRNRRGAKEIAKCMRPEGHWPGRST